jgi:hypothetical protein
MRQDGIEIKIAEQSPSTWETYRSTAISGRIVVNQAVGITDDENVRCSKSYDR